MDELIDLLDTLMKVIIVVLWLLSVTKPLIWVEKLGERTCKLNLCYLKRPNSICQVIEITSRDSMAILKILNGIFTKICLAI